MTVAPDVGTPTARLSIAVRPRKARGTSWHARFALDASLTLSDSEMVMSMLCGIRGANREVVRPRLLAKVDHAGLATVDVPAG